MDSLLKSYPAFLARGLIWEPGPDPPDFIATSAQGERYGLELTEWLNEDQTTVSISNQDSRIGLLREIDSEHSECPKPLIRILICDRLDIPFRKQDRNEYVREIYQLAADYATRWVPEQTIGIWPLRELTPYPMLERYCIAVTLYGPPYPVTAPSGHTLYGPGKRWIDFEPVGGAYDPQWSANALQSRILAKTCKYRGIHGEQSLKQFVLLVHYGIRGMIHNTPYGGRNAKLEDAAVQAHNCLSMDHGEFDSAYLYMNFNGGKLIELFRVFRVLKEYSHQPGVH